VEMIGCSLDILEIAMDTSTFNEITLTMGYYVSRVKQVPTSGAQGKDFLYGCY
jgi:hypothetical protein